MKIHRFYLKEFDGQKTLEISKSPLFHQMSKVLRLKAGEQVSFFYNNKEALYLISFINGKRIVFDFIEDLVSDFNIKRRIHLYQSLIKRDKLELVVQKASELGVFSFHPVISARSEKKDVNLDRLNKIAIEASEQCGRLDFINISDPLKLKEAFNPSVTNIVADLSGQNISSLDSDISKDLNIWIGPEGGWTEEEMLFFNKNKALFVSLNHYILRSETASMVLASHFLNTESPT